MLLIKYETKMKTLKLHRRCGDLELQILENRLNLRMSLNFLEIVRIILQFLNQEIIYSLTVRAVKITKWASVKVQRFFVQLSKTVSEVK